MPNNSETIEGNNTNMGSEPVNSDDRGDKGEKSKSVIGSVAERVKLIIQVKSRKRRNVIIEAQTVDTNVTAVSHETIGCRIADTVMGVSNFSVGAVCVPDAGHSSGIDSEEGNLGRQVDKDNIINGTAVPHKELTLTANVENDRGTVSDIDRTLTPRVDICSYSEEQLVIMT